MGMEIKLLGTGCSNCKRLLPKRRGPSVSLEFAGFRTKVRLRHGVPCEEIDRVAREEDVSLIVIGSKGRSALADTLLGNVSDAIVCGHVRPVLVVHAEEMSASTD
jgi:nucleotide-binding universal stress UspA family protein